MDLITDVVVISDDIWPYTNLSTFLMQIYIAGDMNSCDAKYLWLFV